MRFFWLLSFAGFLFINIPAFSQNDSSDSLRQYELEQVVITGVRLPVEKGKIPASITVVEEDEIERQMEMNVLPVLASKAPGLFLNERGMMGFGVGPQSGGGISIRGLASSGDPANTRTLVLIDGQPQFMGLFGHPIADDYHSENIERIEVIRGPASILYGSNAMGGVVNLITRQQKDEGLTLGAKAAYGSFDTREYHLSAGYKKDRFNIIGSFNSGASEGHREGTADYFSSNGGYLKAGYRISNHLKATIDGNILDSEFNDPGHVDSTIIQKQYYNYLRGRAAVSFENTAEHVEGALRFFYNYGDHDFFDGFRSTDYNRGITFYQNLKLMKGNVLTVGVDYKNYGGEAFTDAFPVNNDIDRSVSETDFYGLVRQTLFDQLNLSAGLRWINSSVYGGIAVPQYGLAYSLGGSSVVKASASKGFRSPTLANLYFAPPANEDLEPEEMWSYELSFLQAFMEKRLELEITGFYNKGTNLIRTIFSQGRPSNINTGEFQHRGIEFQGSLEATDNLNFALNYSLLHTGTPLPYAPKRQLNFQVDYEIGGIQAILSLKTVSGLYQGNVGTSSRFDPELPTQNYQLLNAQLNYPFLEVFTLYGKVENILDQEYMIDAGYPLPGIGMMIGAKMHW